MRHWIGWLKLATTPGMSAIAFRMRLVSSSRVRALVHCPIGLRAPTNPVLSTPRASTATPVWPVRDTIVSSSGNRFSRRSISPVTSSALSSETPGSSWTSMSNAPSSITGMNSVPRRGRAASAATSDRAQPASTRARCASDQRRIGRYTRRFISYTGLTACTGPSIVWQTRGMTKIDSSSDDSSASATANASGENILPSIPWRATIGRNVSAMMSSPKMLGLRTSNTARRITSTMLRSRPLPCRWRWTFST